MLASVGPSRQTGCCCCSLLLALAYATVMILMMMLPLDRQWKTAYTHNVSAERQKGMWSWVMQCTHQHFPQLFNLRWLLISPGAPTHNSPHSLLDFFFLGVEQKNDDDDDDDGTKYVISIPSFPLVLVSYRNSLVFTLLYILFIYI